MSAYQTQELVKYAVCKIVIGPFAHWHIFFNSHLGILFLFVRCQVYCMLLDIKFVVLASSYKVHSALEVFSSGKIFFLIIFQPDFFFQLFLLLHPM